jgi:PTH1 family peptidyl-tRNA hydrolase
LEGRAGMSEKKVIAGLGNPGYFYKETRHNTGFKVIDRIGAEYGIDIRKRKCKTLYGEGLVNDTCLMLVKPQSYMNRSGESIRGIVDWFNIPLKNLIVVYDDVDIPLGMIRVRPHGSAGTHNGMRSVVYSLESEEFARVRIGIGQPHEGNSLIDHVLGRFHACERTIIDKAIRTAAQAAVCAAVEGVEIAMSKYNGSVIGDKDEVFRLQTEGD